MFPIRKIVHPTDFSERSAPAFATACALARDYGADLLVVHVLPPALVVAPNGAATVLDQPADLDEARRQLAQITAPDPHIAVGHRLAQGNPAEEILKIAQSLPADLVVLGTHGWTGLARLLMGSVAETVMRKAPCPVLTVKAPFPAEQSAPPAAHRVAAG